MLNTNTPPKGPANISITPGFLSDVISKNNFPIGMTNLFFPLTTFSSLQNTIGHLGKLLMFDSYVNTSSFSTLTTNVAVLEFIFLSLQ